MINGTWRGVHLKKTHIYRLFSDIHLPQFLIACYILALILETVLRRDFAPVKYLDEATALIMGLVFVIDVIRTRRLDRDEILIIIFTLCMLALGFIGNIKFSLVGHRYYWLLDAFNMFKFIAASLGAVRLFSETKYNEYVIQYLTLFIEIIIATATLCLIINCFKDINMTTDVRYGFRTFNFVFIRVGDFYEAGLYMLAILFADLFVEKRRITWLFIALTMINMASTLRSRAFIFSLLFILFYVIFVIFRVEKIKLRYAIPLVIAAAVTFAGQISYYFTGTTARGVLLRNGIRTMKTYFPLGAGFATFGTAVAQQHYSKLYFRYGFWQYFGTSMKNRSFLLDDYWPAILAEIGIFGAVLMLAVILMLARRNARLCSNPYARVGVYSVWLAMFSSSVVTSSFFAATKAMVIGALVSVFIPIVGEAADTVNVLAVRERFVSFWNNNRFLKKMSILQRFVLIAAVLGVFCVGVLGIRYRAKIQNKFFPTTVRKGASITVNPEPLIFNGGEFEPYTDDILLKNARLRDISFRDKSVDFLRQVTGEKYYELTDEEIEAVTGEKVIGGITKIEAMENSPAGAETDFSAYDEVMSIEEREHILETSPVLDETFDLSGDALKELLRLTVATGGTGNFRDRLMYYYYTTYSGYRLQVKRKLKLEGYHLPSMMIPETLPPVTRDMVKFKAASVRDLKRQYTEFANYLGVTSNNGYGGDGNEEITYQGRWDKYASQRLSVKLIHDTLYGIGVNRKFDVRIEGPEIVLNAQGITLLKGSDFNPYDYVESVRDADGKNMMGLLSIYNPVRTNRPGFYNVAYSCGPDSRINLKVKVATESVYYSLQDK